MAEGGATPNLGKLYYQIEGTFGVIERQLKDFEAKIKPIRVRIEVDPASLQNVTKQIQAAANNAFRTGGAGGAAGGGLGVGGGAGGAGGGPVPVGAPQPAQVVPPPPPPPLPPAPPPLPPPPPRPPNPRQPGQPGRGGRSFMGPPSGMGLYMSALFGGWELSSAYNAIRSSEMQAGYQDPLTAERTRLAGINQAASGPMGASIAAIWNLSGASNSPFARESALAENAFIRERQDSAQLQGIRNRFSQATRPFAADLSPTAQFGVRRAEIERERDEALMGVNQRIGDMRSMLSATRTETYADWQSTPDGPGGTVIRSRRVSTLGTAAAGALQRDLAEAMAERGNIGADATARLNRVTAEEAVAKTQTTDALAVLRLAGRSAEFAVQGRTLESDLAAIEAKYGRRDDGTFAGDDKFFGRQRDEYNRQREMDRSVDRTSAFQDQTRRRLMAGGGTGFSAINAARMAGTVGIDPFSDAFSMAEAPFTQQGHQALLELDRNVNMMQAQTRAYNMGAAANNPALASIGLLGAQIMGRISDAPEGMKMAAGNLGVAQLQMALKELTSGGRAVAGRLSGTEIGGIDTSTKDLENAIRDLIAKIDEWLQNGGQGNVWQ